MFRSGTGSYVMARCYSIARPPRATRSASGARLGYNVRVTIPSMIVYEQ